MQKHPELTLQRIKLFASVQGLGNKLYIDRAPVKLSVYHAPDRITYAEALAQEYRPASVGQSFGPFWSTHWFRVENSIPAAWAGKEVHFLWDSSSEAEVWQDGKPLQGLTGSENAYSSDAIRPEFVLSKHACGGESFTLMVEMAVNHLFGLGSNPDPARLANVGVLRQAEIAVFDHEAWNLFWDFRVIADMALNLPLNTPRGGQALFAANKMIDAINLEDRSTWIRASEIAAEFFAARAGDGQLNLSAVGHAHIDTAWLWPLAETRRKCTRTFSTALRYMEDYPEYRFACSQAQQYEWMKEMHPDLFEKIAYRVKTEQFIPAGGSWVEPDCNLPSGESLVRQFLFGQRFFRREFGLTCEEFWEPDVFGYSAALPQILRQAGIRYFLTIKLSWNQFNKLSSHTFWWEGLDGSQVLTHFPPADTYNSMADVKEVLYSASNYKDLDRSKEAYLLFGYGDGGGGPTTAMLEQLRRMQNVDGLPKVEMRTPKDFFTRLEADGKDLTTWVGELYFELHRGTYTSQANNKKNNRLSEFMLHDVEFLSAVAHVEKNLPYPKDELDRLWKIVLTSQFHDIIPGSSINLVYQDSDAHYKDVLETGAALRKQAASTLLEGQEQNSKRVCAVNTTSFERTEVVALPEGAAAVQTSADGKPLGIVTAPSYGYAIVDAGRTSDQKATITEDLNSVVLENDYVRAVFSRGGSLISLFDKRANRESIEPGQQGNHFVIFDDMPVNWDAWDVDIFHLEKRNEVGPAMTCRVIEHGPLRAAVAFEYALSSASTLAQIVQLTALSPRLEFNTEVEWRERHKFLKVEFPLNVRAANATYEIQFGHLQRPTHFNTSWDMARFEVPAHRWADLSDPCFGVSLLNDSKYGYAVHGNVMRLSLLRAPTAPDPEADQGHHTFRYALLPHAGAPQTAGVIEQGYTFNMPLLLSPVAAEPSSRCFFQVSSPAVVIDTVKKAEDSEDIIVRLYESHGTHGTALLQTVLPARTVRRCNLLEDDGDDEPVSLSDGKYKFSYCPFELITLKITLQ